MGVLQPNYDSSVSKVIILTLIHFSRWSWEREGKEIGVVGKAVWRGDFSKVGKNEMDRERRVRKEDD